MSRLTKRINGIEMPDGTPIYDVGMDDISEIPDLSEGKRYIGHSINKLGKLEDIEELLGIDLASIVTLDTNDRLVISVKDAEHKKAIVINVSKNQIEVNLE